MISNDGSRVFFVTADKLVPQASNGAQNVYEFENGEPHLTAPGDTEGPIALLGASESGDDVFLVTTENSRRAKGEPGRLRRPGQCPGAAGVHPVGCQGENCRGPRTQPPNYTSSGTAVLRSDHQGRRIGAEERQGRHRPDPGHRAR